MNLLIIEPEGGGHHMALYVRILVRTAVVRGWNINLLTTKEAVKHSGFKLVLEECNNISINYMPNFKRSSSSNWLSLLIDQLKCYMSVKSGFRDIMINKKIDAIYMINLDHIDKPLALLGSPFGKNIFSGMMMNIKFHRKKMNIGRKSRSDWLYKKLFLLQLKIKSLKFLAVIDEPLFNYMSIDSKRKYQNLLYVPDVGELKGNYLKLDARNFLNIPTDAFTILVYGYLTPKKGIEQLLLAVSICNNSKIKILLAGLQNDEIIELLKTPLSMHLISCEQLLIYPYFHNQNQEFIVFQSANLVWVGYVGHSFGSSGVLYQSCSIGLPVLATSYGLVGWIVKQHQLGLTFDPHNSVEVAEAIQLLFEDQSKIDFYSINAKSLAKKHTELKFGDTICDAIQKK